MVDSLVAAEEPEISALLKEELSKRMGVYTGVQAQELRKNGNGVTVVVKDKNTGRENQFTAQKVLVAVGRKSNADLLKLENTGVETDERGFIKVNEHLETGKENILAVGDINGQQMFTHMANRQAILAAHNVLHGARLKIDFAGPPHAIFSHPQIAAVGLTEEKARKNHRILVGRAEYSDVASGEAMIETRGFAKAIVEKDSDKILGFHIIGPYASILIQEVINAMSSEGHIGQINDGIHIHPALPELISRALSNLEEP
jgi:dihydrolipoamide dehydrogenase